MAAGLDVGCRSLEVVVPFPWCQFLRGLPALPLHAAFCGRTKQSKGLMRQIAIARPATSDIWNNAVIGWPRKNGVVEVMNESMGQA